MAARSSIGAKAPAASPARALAMTVTRSQTSASPMGASASRKPRTSSESVSLTSPRTPATSPPRSPSARPVDILLRIQDKTPPLYRPSLVESVPVDRAPCRRSYTFTAVMTSTATGEVTFQLGGLGSYTVSVDNAVLAETEA